MLRNIFSNWALVVVQMGVLLYQTPIQVKALGLAGQDVWLTIAALTGYLVLLTLGLPMASVRFITAHVARKEVDQTNTAIATCLAVSLALAAAALVVSGGFWLFFDHTYLRSAGWQTLPPEVREGARIAFWISALQVSLNFVAQLPYGILDAHHDFLSRNGVKIAGILVRLVLIVGVLRVYPSLVLLALIQIAAMAIEFAAALWVIRRSWPHLRFGLRGVDRGRVREILGFSLYAMLLNMGSQLSFQSDQLVINAYGDPDAGTFFDVGNKFFPPLLQLILGIGMVMMPMATKLQATGQLDELRHAFLKWSKVAYSMALLVGVYLLVVGPEFLAWWMGPSFAMNSGRVTRVIMFAFLFFLPVRGVASPMLMGLGKPVWVSLAFLAMGVVNLGLSLWLMGPLGIYGVAVGTAIPCVLFAVGVALLACREAGVTPAEYLGYVVLRPTLGVLPPIFFLYFLKRGMHVFNVFAPRWVEFFPLFFSGVGMLGLFLVTWVAYVYRNDPYVDVSSRIDRFVPQVLRGTGAGRAVVSLTGLGVVLGAGLLAIVLRDADPLVSVLISVGAVAASLVMVPVEIVVRAIIRRWGGYYRYTPYWRERHSWEPGSMPGFPESSMVEINGAGERGDPPPARGEPCYRALVVGGSAAECYYLSQDATWPAVVQRILGEPQNLAALGVPRVHVGNVARAIVPVEQIHFMLRKMLPRYDRLDLILIMVGGSDVVSWVERGAGSSVPEGSTVLDKLFEQHPESRFGWRPRQTAVWRLLSHWNRRYRRSVVVDTSSTAWLHKVRRMRAEAPDRVDEVPDPAPMLAHFEKHLRGLLETARARAGRVILVRQPWFGPNPTPEEEKMFWNFGLGRPYKETVSAYFTPRVVDALMRAMDERAAAVAASLGVQQVDVGSAIEHSARTFYDELHFTPEGAAAVGRVVAAAIVSGGRSRGADPQAPAAGAAPSRDARGAPRQTSEEPRAAEHPPHRDA